MGPGLSLIHLGSVRPQQAVGGAGDDLQLGAVDQARQRDRGGVDGQGAVGVAVDDQGGDVDSGQVLAEVGQPGLDAVERALGGGADGDVPAGVDGLLADPFAAEDVVVVEVGEEVGHEGEPVGADGILDAFEDGRVDAAGVVVGLEEEGRDDAEQDGLADPLGAVGAQVAGHFAGAHREADQDGVAQVEGGQHLVEVGGEGVVVVAVGGLVGAAEAAPVVGDAKPRRS